MSYKELIDENQIPAHVAIIMDGNGRWAKQRGKDRSYGHQMGVETVRVITEEATRLGVRYLTLYTFSMENWNRPEQEVTALMDLLMNSLEEEIFMKNNIRLHIIGDLSKMPEKVRTRVLSCMDNTSKNTGMCVVLAISYSSRWEITQAVQQLATDVKQGKINTGDINEEMVEKRLNTSFMPNPDLLIRTGGEIRLSNFLLWQCAYSELYFSDLYWPDFRQEEFLKAIYEYQQRERRFGKISEQLN